MHGDWQPARHAHVEPVVLCAVSTGGDEVERVECASTARDLDEPLAGTAALATGWIAVEHRGPWSERAPGPVELGPLADHLATPGVRVQLVRPVRIAHLPDDPAQQRPHTTVLLAHGGVDPTSRWMRRLHLADPAELLDLDPTVTLATTPPALGEAVDHDVWLVCTHARRDACCAVRGRPTALALAASGHEVWETTHTGGHRFAATALVLPDGLSLGQLDEVDVVAVADALAGGRLPLELLRGRCSTARPGQAAEAALRLELGTDARDGVLPERVDLREERAEVTLRAGSERWHATVAIAPADRPRAVSDDAEPTTPVTHTVTALRRAPD